ncbi:sensor histidine kinase [Kineosporia sp. A_224]|uniref:sensor histidine kinase n=1 Tax=Kineosporia sp. A_224 TaxID=1962180 RepID=UPI000B4A7262|nr:histidine kinase [Kineosporia sp. A_224]
MTPVAAVRTWAERPVVRARASDALYAALCLADAGSAADTTWRDHGPWAGAGVVVVGLLATAVVVLLRRTRPVLVVLCTLPAAFAGGVDLPMTLALFAVAIRRRDRTLGGLAVLTWLAFVVAAILEDGNWAEGAIAGSIIVSLASVGGAYVGARRDLLASLRERAEQAEATALLLQRQARFAERTRIAREMHDVVAHRISLVALHAGALEVNPGSGPERVEKAAALIGTTARQALEDLRGVLGVLRADPDQAVADDVALAPQPRLEDVPRLVEASVAAGVPVRFEDRRPDGAPPVDEVVGRTVYRVVQEALTNVHKHARSAQTRVVVTSGGPGAAPGDDVLRVEVTNARPVAGSALVPGSGTGLVGLRERVGLAGGTLDAGPLPGGGWRVAATFPRRPA